MFLLYFYWKIITVKMLNLLKYHKYMVISVEFKGFIGVGCPC